MSSTGRSSARRPDTRERRRAPRRLRLASGSLVALVSLLAPPAPAAPILSDGFEPAAPSAWSSAAGWSCPDGDAPVPGNALAEAAGDPGCPPGMVAVESFCIDRFEASLAEILPGPALTPWSSYLAPGATPTRALSAAMATPQGYLDQVTAASACAASGKRLCTDAEWLRACRGPSAWTYPWGNDPAPGTCNDTRATHPLVEYYGTTDAWIWNHTDQPCLNQLPASLDRAGERSSCVTVEGVFDMVGNLLEWTSDPSGTLRGGSYVESSINGLGCLYVTTAHSVAYADFLTGFRCCADLGARRAR